MDRRSFIATASAATALACASPMRPAHAWAGLRATPTQRTQELMLACPSPESAAGLFDEACVLARDLERALEARVKIDVVSGPQGSIESIAGKGADLFYGPEQANAAHVPALAFVAGLPGRLAMDARGFRIFMEQHGGSALWAEALEGYGVTPIYAGHAGEAPVLWSRVSLNTLSGRSVATSGLNAQVVAGLGGAPVPLSSGETASALGSGRTDAVEIATLTQAIALKIPQLARYAARAPLADHAGALSLSVNTRVWRNWTPQMREAVLSSVRDYSLRRERHDAHSAAILQQAIAQAYGTIYYDCKDAPRVRRVGEAVVAELAGSSEQTRQFNDAYMAACSQVRLA
ncbi:MAG: hypothetical protein JNL45_12385 [Hyphomicrobium sp.]|nr:hypothetical protein [Hyphomicrobium sp.]